jgi:hypothetical protein
MLLQRFKKPHCRHALEKPCQATEHHRNLAQAFHQKESHRVYAINLRQKIISLKVEFSLSPRTGQKAKHHSLGKKTRHNSKITINLKRTKPISQKESH